MNPSGCPSTERFGRLLASDLPPEEESPLAAHLGECPRCQELTDRLLADDSVLTWRRARAARRAAGPPAAFMTSMRQMVSLVAHSPVSLEPSAGAGAGGSPREEPGAGPARIGAYEVLGRLGHGGMAVVYLARQPGLGRPVALKVIRPDGPASADAQRFSREAATVARMHHPNIVQVYEVGEDNGRAFFALEYVPGGTLAEYLRGTPADPRDAAELVEAVARAVHHAHEQGIIHRDLKPSNILLDPAAPGELPTRALLSQFRPKVADFGLARAVTEDQTLTVPGTLVGTPAYLAPESVRHPGTATPAGDVYSLGVVLFEALTGRPPLIGPTTLATLRLVDAVDPLPPSRLQPHLPRDLDTICLACLRKNPRRRYGSALALAEDLRRFLDGRPVLARRVGRVETAWLWCRRNPAPAALGAALAGSVLLGLLTTSVLLGQARESAAAATASAVRARANESLAVQAAALAEANARLANDRAYASDIQFASLMWMDRQHAALVDLLGEHRVEKDGVDRRGFEWSFLWACAHPPHRSVPLDSQGRDLAAARDGRYFAVATSDPEVKVLDGSGNLVRTLAGTGRVIRVDVSADGRRVAGGTEDGTAFVWDEGTGSVVRTLTGHAGAVFAVRFHPDGRSLVTAGQDGTVRVWELENQRAEARVMRHPDVVFASVDFSPDGKLLAVGGSDRLVRVWDAATWTGRPPLSGHQGEVLALRFSPDSALLASGARDRTVRLWDAATGKPVRTLSPHTDAVSSVAFSPDGRSLATVSFDRSVRVADVESGLDARVLLGHDDVVTGVAFGPGGRALATTGWDRTVRVWDIGAPPPQRVWRGHPKPVRAVAFSPRGDMLATGSADGTVRVWDPATGTEQQVLGEGAGGVLGLAFAPDGTLATAAADKQIRVWDVGARRVTRTLTGHGETITDVRFRTGGRLLAGAGGDGSVFVWDLAGGTAEGRRLAKFASPVAVVRFDPSGATLAAGCRDGTVHLLDAATGEPRRRLEGHAGGVNAMDFSPDGAGLAVGSADRIIRLWDPATGELTGSLRGHVRGVTAVQFGPDGRRLFSGSQDGTLQIWHVRREQPLVILTDQHETAALAASPDGSTIATAGPTGLVSVWRSAPPISAPVPRR